MSVASSSQIGWAALERDYFEDLKARTLAALKGPHEHVYLGLTGEQSQFLRINGAKVRQVGAVEDAQLELSFLLESAEGVRKSMRAFTLTGLIYEDSTRLRAAIEDARRETAELPLDPFAQLPQNFGSSNTEIRGKLLPIEEAPTALIDPLLADGRRLDLAGIYAAGRAVRAMANSAGQTHWFATDTFSLDYSIYTPGQRAIKGTFAGKEWDARAYAAEMRTAAERLPLLEVAPRRIERGGYRAYLAPAAVHDLISMFSWGGVSEAAIRQGDSPLRRVRSGEKRFSPKFTLLEDFRGGETPRFNGEGVLSPEMLPLIVEGQLQNTLIGSRTAKEYALTTNGAGDYEGMRSPAMATGNLDPARALEVLGTGFYLSNLHYLNWSDQPGGRVTGMTRFACFWVENGKIVSPIENMRWDDSLFELFGDQLEDLTTTRTYLPEVGTYGARSLGGANLPGMLVKRMTFTI